MQKTHVVMLLDESSSMINHRQAVVDTFNEYIASLKQDTKRCWLSLFKFAGGGEISSLAWPIAPRGTLNLEKVFENRKVKETYALTPSQYSPNGWTPLYDAIGALIQRTKKRLPNDAKVLFVVHTDGQENTSQKYSMDRVKNLIKKVENKRGWTFIYLGEGAEAWNAGYDFGIQNVANFSSNLRGAAMGSLASATSCYVMDSNVGGSAGSTHTIYQNAGVSADNIDDDDKVTFTSVMANADKDAMQLKSD